MAHIKVNQDYSGEVNWNGWTEAFENIAADAREQLGCNNDQPQRTVGLSDEDIQGFFIQGTTLRYDSEMSES